MEASLSEVIWILTSSKDANPQNLTPWACNVHVACRDLDKGASIGESMAISGVSVNIFVTSDFIRYLNLS